MIIISLFYIFLNDLSMLRNSLVFLYLARGFSPASALGVNYLLTVFTDHCCISGLIAMIEDPIFEHSFPPKRGEDVATTVSRHPSHSALVAWLLNVAYLPRINHPAPSGARYPPVLLINQLHLSWLTAVYN